MRHLTRDPDIDAVTALITEAVAELMLPRFGHLRAEDVRSKASASDPGDLVTVVDREMEERLTRGLRDLAPSAVVVGEEAVHKTPALLEHVGGDDPVWLLDPLDGTRNFARGNADLGVLLAWVTGGLVRAGWLVLPARDETFVAEAGSGAFRNGDRISVPAGPPPEPWRGSVYVRFMPEPLTAAITEASVGRFQPLAECGCAAVEYANVLEARKEFALYYRLLPWDHAAPALILAEGGGCVEHLNGQPYRVRSSDQVTVVARDGRISERVRGWLGGAVSRAHGT
jgi:fructose-1,6-bisphosphatase/inositol monophosphatase family enzyme